MSSSDKIRVAQNVMPLLEGDEDSNEMNQYDQQKDKLFAEVDRLGGASFFRVSLNHVLQVNQPRERLIVVDNVRKRLIAIFGDMCQAWASYELYMNINQVRHLSNVAILPINGKLQGISTEEVADIAEDQRLVITPGIDFPIPLPNAVMNQFFELVKKEKWWEALNLIDLSKKGKHLIACRTTESGHYPELIASVRPQEVRREEPKENLFSSPFFRNENWKSTVDRNAVRNAIESVFNHHPQLEKSLDYSNIPGLNGGNVEEVEEGIIETLGKDSMSEFIRLTFGKVDRKTAIGTMINFTKPQTRAGIIASFAIMEDPYVKIFEAMERRTERRCFLSLAKHRIKDTDRYDTHKLLLLTPNISVA